MIAAIQQAEPLGTMQAIVTGWVQPLVVALFIGVQALLVVYSAHRYLTLARWWRARKLAQRAPEAPAAWPPVTVQLPIFNERMVVERLIDAVAAFHYPASRLEIQVLDDSTDETLACGRAAVERHRARGIDITLHHRARRDGYKAGALAAGLACARGDLIAIFDADFVPDPDFLTRTVPHFEDAEVGMVQTRWGHLNRGRSLLTAGQAAMLDAHFLLEHEARAHAGLFFNFNGTAGVWRRACIEGSGGWTHDTLTEDLDLSYRAQLQGWRFVSVPRVVAPAELPGEIEALKSQQRRWAKGSVQTARKLLPALFRSAEPTRVKIEALFHLTSNFAYPLLLLSGLLLLPVMLATSSTPPAFSIALDFAVIATGIVPVCLFLAAGQLAAGARGLAVARDVVAVLVLGAGLTVNNTWAVFEGLGGRMGDWERTPKTGDGRAGTRLRPYASPRSRSGWIELALAAYFAVLVGVAWRDGHVRSIPFLLVLLIGLGYVGVLSLRPRWALAVLLALTAVCVAPARAADPEFGAYWHDGKAEIDGYRLSVVRYAKPRVGRGALIYVTEPFSESKHVKIEDAAKLPAEAFDAFKLNLVRSFQTGIYDYHTMVSLFTRSASFAPVKITFTSAEWCGQVFDHLDFRAGKVTDRFESYFEDESSSRTLEFPRDGIAEDALFILLRGLRGAFVEPGKTRAVQLLPSPFVSRLTHRPAAWKKATIDRLAAPTTVKVPAGTFAADVYVVRGAGREGRFEIERDYPHRIVRWAWKGDATTGPAAWLGGADSGELTGSVRLEYWKLHEVGDEKYLEKLGLDAVVK